MTDWPERPKRSSVFIDAALDSVTRETPMQLVRIRDLSEGGAKIEGKAPPVGAKVVLSRGIVEIAGRVVWVEGRLFGVSFDDPIAVDLLIRAAGQGKSPPRPLHASALTSGLTPPPPAARRKPQPLDRKMFGLRIASPR